LIRTEEKLAWLRGADVLNPTREVVSDSCQHRISSLRKLLSAAIHELSPIHFVQLIRDLFPAFCHFCLKRLLTSYRDHIRRIGQRRAGSSTRVRARVRQERS